MGIAALEDKIVQHAVGTVLNQIWEEDILGFSYGFRPGRSQHDALDALYVGITQKKVNWILDLDVKSFFDKVEHDWMIQFVEHRIADRRIVRLIQKWLKAGVMEEGRWFETEEGTPQGAVISPILANLYLHMYSIYGPRHGGRRWGRVTGSSSATPTTQCWGFRPERTQSDSWSSCGSECGGSDWSYTQKRVA